MNIVHLYNPCYLDHCRDGLIVYVSVVEAEKLSTP